MRERFNSKRDYSISQQQFIDEKGLVAESPFLQNILDELSQYVIDPLEKVFEVYVSFASYKTASEKVSYENILFFSKEFLQIPNSFEKVSKLSSKSRFYLLYSHILASESKYVSFEKSYSLIAHLEALELAGYPEVVIVKDFDNKPVLSDFAKTDGFLKSFKTAEPSSDFRTAVDYLLIDASDLSEYFATIDSKMEQKIQRLYYEDHNLLTVMLLLRRVYGEEKILALVARIKEENFDWTALQLVQFLKNWDEINEYPLDWAVSVA